MIVRGLLSSTPNGLELREAPRSEAEWGAARPRHLHRNSPSWPGPLSKMPRSVRGSEWLGRPRIDPRMMRMVTTR
jgi:hypothetical protein